MESTLVAQSIGYTSKTLDHLGLVAQMCRELKIAETINRSFPSGEKKVSHGDAVVAMIVNGLGFTTQPLYLTPYFFKDKPVDRLIHPQLSAEDLNAPSLGRTLDALYDYGPSELFCALARQAVSVLDLSSPSAHLDSSSFHLHGHYEDQTPPLKGQEIIRITRGYSRDHRPDLNQIILNMIVENQASIPLFMASASGNSSDKNDFRKIIKTHIGQLQNTVGIEYIICDSALYVKETLQEIADLSFFITRVPETIKGTQALFASMDLNEMTAMNEDYSFIELGSIFADVAQRWIVIHSKAAQQRASKTFKRQLSKKIDKQSQAFKKLKAREFSCQEDAQKALEQFSKKNSYLQFNAIEFKQQAHYSHSGRPRLNEGAKTLTYSIQAAVFCDLERIQTEETLKGFFILATNQLDTEKLSAEEVLKEYKGQNQVERGFRFLKSPEFLADSFFLKSTARLMALLMVMTLCLMVYAALQYRIRQSLQNSNEDVNNQLGKPIQDPTARWVFQIFDGIHLLYLEGNQTLILNLNETHIKIIELLGEHYKQIYQNTYLPHPTYRDHIWG